MLPRSIGKAGAHQRDHYAILHQDHIVKAYSNILDEQHLVHLSQNETGSSQKFANTGIYMPGSPAFEPDTEYVLRIILSCICKFIIKVVCDYAAITKVRCRNSQRSSLIPPSRVLCRRLRPCISASRFPACYDTGRQHLYQ